MSDRIDISEPVAQICRALGFEPNVVKSITLTAPGTATLEVFALNAQGQKWVDGEGKIQVDPVTRRVSL